MFAGAGRLDDEFMMQIGGNADVDGIDILPVQKGPVVIDHLRDAELLCQRLSAPLCPGRYRQDFDFPAPQGFIIVQMQMGRKLGPDDSNSQWWHEGLLSLSAPKYNAIGSELFQYSFFSKGFSSFCR